MAAFSRLQLAAALIEYDNDLENPDAIQRSANDSAIFSHLRKRNLTPRTKSVAGLDLKSETDLLQVPLPDGSGQGGQNSRKSRASISTLQNPFRGDLLEEDEPEEEEAEEPEVDLSSWGLDAILPQKPKEKHSRKTSHAKTLDLPVRSTNKQQSEDSTRPPMRRPATVDEFGTMCNQPNEVPGSQRHSISWDRRSITSQNLLDENRARSPGPNVKTVPFPQTEDDTFTPPLPPMSRASRFDPKVQAHVRTISAMSMGSELLALDHESRPRTISGGTLATIGSQIPQLAVEDHSLRDRTTSNASFGSRDMLRDHDSVGDLYEDPQYTRADLLRPKVLVMPSPLQDKEVPHVTSPTLQREGFQISQNGFPFPHGAQTAARSGIRPLSSMLASASFPGPSSNNPFTANPRQNLTLSQLTFRNSLMVGGHRDVSYNDIETHLIRAENEGEQAEGVPKEEEEEEKIEEVRPAGKLFGKSLIDDLEARKLELRSKQRTFMGDQRVSMMARTSTLINPEELKSSNSRSTNTLPRSNLKRKTLIDLDDNTPATQGRMAKSSSVFGVDTVWERELIKLKEIEQQEAAIAAEEKRRKEGAEAGKMKKLKGKSRKHVEEIEEIAGPSIFIPEEPPTLPGLELRQASRKVPEPESESSSDEGEVNEEGGEIDRKVRTATWYASDSDENRPIKTLSPPVATNVRSPVSPRVVNSDDEDDVPLNQISRNLIEKVRMEDSDEDKPLSSVLTKLKVFGGTPAQSPTKQNDDSNDDDEVPLAMRRLTTMNSFNRFNNPGYLNKQDDDDDDEPLGLKVQNQAQTPWIGQQTMSTFNPGFPAMSMSMGPPSIMGVNPMSMSFMQPQPMLGPFFGAPPQEPAQNNFGKIDAWRRGVE